MQFRKKKNLSALPSTHGRHKAPSFCPSLSLSEKIVKGGDGRIVVGFHFFLFLFYFILSILFWEEATEELKLRKRQAIIVFFFYSLQRRRRQKSWRCGSDRSSGHELAGPSATITKKSQCPSIYFAIQGHSIGFCTGTRWTLGTKVSKVA